VRHRPLPEPCPACGGLLLAHGSQGARCTQCHWQGEPQVLAEPTS
jgi:ribosomal protein S27AE